MHGIQIGLKKLSAMRLGEVRFMGRLRAGLVGFAAILVFAPGVAGAKNYCISGFPNGTFVLVGVGFTVPSKGTCKTWTGLTTQNDLNSPSAGTGCTSSNGTELSLTITTSVPQNAGHIEIDSITLSLPKQTGGTNSTNIKTGVVTSFSGSGITGGACTSSLTIPASAATEESPEADVGGAAP
jgi:hypothetical protein